MNMDRREALQRAAATLVAPVVPGSGATGVFSDVLLGAGSGGEDVFASAIEVILNNSDTSEGPRGVRAYLEKRWCRYDWTSGTEEYSFKDLVYFYLEGIKGIIASGNLGFFNLEELNYLLGKIQSLRNAENEPGGEYPAEEVLQTARPAVTHQGSIYFKMLLEWLENNKLLPGSQEDRATIRSYTTSSD
jgi:hypothetical protein